MRCLFATVGYWPFTGDAGAYVKGAAERLVEEERKRLGETGYSRVLQKYS